MRRLARVCRRGRGGEGCRRLGCYRLAADDSPVQMWRRREEREKNVAPSHGGSCGADVALLHDSLSSVSGRGHNGHSSRAHTEQCNFMNV